MPSRKFYDGFESYTADQDIPDTNGWTQDGTNPLMTCVTSGDIGPKAGSKMARSNMTNTDFQALKKSFTSLYTNECLFRMWFMFDANVSHPAGSGVHCMRMLSGTNDLLQASRGTGDWISDIVIAGGRPCGGGVPYETSYPDSSVWHKFELYIKLDTTTAIKTWYNDVLVADCSGLDWQGWKPDTFFLNSNNSGTWDDTNYFYIDEFEFFSDATDGTATTGSLDDASIEVSGGAAATVKAERIITFGGSRRRVLLR